MRKKLIMALALMATMAFGCIVFERSSFAQNSNSSTTSDRSMGRTNRRMGRRRHRRVRRHGRWSRQRRGGMKTGNGNRH